MKRSYSFILIMLLLLLVITSFVSLLIGPAKITFSRVLEILFSKDGGLAVERTIIYRIRLPRIILALLVGGGLSFSGVVFQGIFRNPLVEPYTLGISGGAALGVCVGIILSRFLFFYSIPLPVFGFLGALGIVSLFYLFGKRSGYYHITNLLLIGVMLSFISSSVVMFVLTFLQPTEIHNILFWTMGHLTETDFSLLNISLIFIALGTFISLFFSHQLNILSLGEDEAQHLGVNVVRIKKILFFTASLITGTAVSIAGIIGFVGLVVPHMLRTLFGPDHRFLLPASLLGGGIFLLVCDIFSRVIFSPAELPTGIITGIVGGFLFIYLLRRKNTPFGEK